MTRKVQFCRQKTCASRCTYGMKCDAGLQAEREREKKKPCTRLAGLFSVNAKQRSAINLRSVCVLLIISRRGRRLESDVDVDVPLLPNSVGLPVLLLMAVGSGSVEKVAKTFPKIIQAVKKLMFSFPILLSQLFFAKESVQLKKKKCVSWTSAVYPRGLKQEKRCRGAAVWG